MRTRVEHAMEIPEVISNPLFFSILEGLRSDYTMLDPAPQRSMSPKEQQ